MVAFCNCFIIPKSVLERFAADASLSAASRKAFADTAKGEHIWRALRAAHNVATQALPDDAVALAPVAAITVFTCNGTTSLPGTSIANPGSSGDATAKRTFDETTGVAKFYRDVFGRNSVDNSGMTLVSSIHYDQKYNNAFWNGNQMTYGDGDGQIFLDFTLSNDVIGHELTHGVTQNTAGLLYANEPGGLNESISDCFGSMFRQWEANQDFAAADWLIGSGIMGPAAKLKNFVCLRDMAAPGAAHCMSKQPFHYKDYVPGGDPHLNSGIPNQGFYLACKAMGGKSWEKVGQVWYAALTGGQAKKTTGFKAFAKLTRAAAKTKFPADAAVFKAVDSGWKGVGL